MAEVSMPRLSDTMEEGTIGQWLKKEGDRVEKGDMLLEIETDKATMTQESYDAGILEKILVQTGQTVPIGTVIAIIGDGSGQASDAVSAQPVSSGENAPRPAAIATPPAMHTTSREGRIKVSPLARKIAAEHNIFLDNLNGSGPGWRIVKDDVLKALSSGQAALPATSTGAGPSITPEIAPPTTSPSPTVAPPLVGGATVSGGNYEEQPLSRMRQVVARRMTEAKQQVPHIYLTTEIDMTEALKWRQTINASLEKAGGPKVTVNDMIIKAVAKALRKVPSLNTSFDNNKLRTYHRVHIAFAVALEDGLITPVVRDADQKALSQIATETKVLVDKARKGKLGLDEYQGGTFTISNMGMFDIDSFSAVINQPQAAILAIGSTKPTVVVKGDTDSDNPQFGVAQIMKVTISVDHRAANGADGAQYLQELKKILQNPLLLLV